MRHGSWRFCGCGRPDAEAFEREVVAFGAEPARDRPLQGTGGGRNHRLGAGVDQLDVLALVAGRGSTDTLGSLLKIPGDTSSAFAAARQRASLSSRSRASCEPPAPSEASHRGPALPSRDVLSQDTTLLKCGPKPPSERTRSEAPSEAQPVSLSEPRVEPPSERMEFEAPSEDTVIETVPEAASGVPGRLGANLMYFARTLRAAGLPVGSGAVLDALRAVEAVGVARRDDFYWALHAVFVRRADQRPLFDEAFHVFWRNPKLLERVASLLLPSVHAPAGRHRPLSRRLSEALFAGAERKARTRRRSGRSSSTRPSRGPTGRCCGRGISNRCRPRARRGKERPSLGCASPSLRLRPGATRHPSARLAHRHADHVSAQPPARIRRGWCSPAGAGSGSRLPSCCCATSRGR